MRVNVENQIFSHVLFTLLATTFLLELDVKKSPHS